MSEETEETIKLSDKRQISMPMALLMGLLATTADGAIAWSVTRSDVQQNTKDIMEVKHAADVLGGKVANDHDVLIEIRADVKRLLREDHKP